jgi:hypothetical protein
VQLTSLRVAVHSVAGCFFYGAFTAKVLLVPSRRLPGWALPAAGGMLAIIIGRESCGTPRRCGTTTVTSYLTRNRKASSMCRPYARARSDEPP